MLKYKYILAIAFLLSIILKLININTGGPQLMIDDFTLYEGGFLVWFGNAPPQHAYLECWINGISNMIAYVVRLVNVGTSLKVLDFNVVCNAYRDYYNYPDIYYSVYRLFMTLVDICTAFIVYKVARLVFDMKSSNFWAAFVCFLYLFSYNTYWCNLVGRPDTLVTFFGIAGTYLYLRSDYKPSSPSFWCAAAAFGVTAGLKLHGAFFAIFAALDLIRTRGSKDGVKAAMTIAAISLFFFMIADGTILFDPLKYIKARWLTYGHDLSPGMTWGNHFLILLRGTGWVVAPLVLFAQYILLTKHNKRNENLEMRSVVFMSICWLLLFLSIRQLRAYWMLPALPIFFMSAIYVIININKISGRWLLTSALAGIFLFQSANECFSIFTGRHKELRNWITQKINPNETFFILGYTVTSLPRNTSYILSMKQLIQKGYDQDLQNDMPFTIRHLKNWEELSTLKLFEMLNYRSETGYDYYGFYDYDPDFFKELFYRKSINYIILQEFFPLNSVPYINKVLNNQFEFIKEVRGEGGMGYGLTYKIYKLRQN